MWWFAFGATAARTVFGKPVKILERRGELVESELTPRVVVTVHPSSILRIVDAEMRQVAMQQFVNDLRKVREALGNGK